ncbi:MAG TPA: tetratricopeptide repeat protein [Verrucomicrobiae bacterium]|nr:tetratricopeptide repeat protein [Verrucomicrobiae bacterium]
MIVRAVSYAVAAALAGVLLCSPPASAQSGPTKLVNSPSIFEPVFASDPNGAIAAARARIAAGDLDGAIKGLEIYVVSHPNDVRPTRFLGDLYYRAGRFGKAEYEYQTLIAKDPGDKESHNRLGVVYATENRIDDAIREFDEALPGTDSVDDLVAMHVRKGDLPAYEAQMRRLAADQPTDADIQAEMGQVLAALHKPGEAIGFYERALDSDTSSLTAHNGLGLAYLELHDYADAERQFKACLAIDADNYSCNDNVAATYLESGRYDDALPVLRRTYKLAPERPEAIVNFGYLADMQGNWKKAVSFYVKAIGVGPYRPEAYIDLGIDYESNNLYQLAESALLKGVAAAPLDGRIRFLLGRAYAEQGLTSLAIEQFSAAEKSFDPNIVRIAQQESAKLAATSATTGQ